MLKKYKTIIFIIMLISTVAILSFLSGCSVEISK